MSSQGVPFRSRVRAPSLGSQSRTIGQRGVLYRSLGDYSVLWNAYHRLRHIEDFRTMSWYRRQCAIEKGCVVRTCNLSAGRPKGEMGSLSQQFVY